MGLLYGGYYHVHRRQSFTGAVFDLPLPLRHLLFAVGAVGLYPGFCVSMLWPGNLVVATEQFGMKAGMLVGMLFPLAAIQACLINGKKR